MPIFFNKDKPPKRVKILLAPKKEFVKKTKIVFLSVFKEKFGWNLVPRKRFSLAFKFTVLVLAIAGATNVLAVYADNQNVGPANPLYSLKRYYESLVLALTKQSDKPQLEVELAQKRLEEIEAVKSANDKKNIADEQRSVDQDKNEESAVRRLEDDAANSLAAAENEGTKGNDSGSPAFCNPVNKLFINSTSSHLRRALDNHPKILDDFNEKCAGFLGNATSGIIIDDSNENSIGTYNLKSDNQGPESEDIKLTSSSPEKGKVENKNHSNKND